MADIFSGPATLIDTIDGKLTVNEQALQQVSQLDGSLVIVAIAGLYRTGKSYLMNRLAGKSSGFALGNAIESKTKGIWIWAVKHPKKKDSYLILLDTEGLGDVYKGDQNHDNWIFCLATLLSSVLCYNAKGAIDDDALKKVNFITEMSKHIRSKSSDASDASDVDFDLFFPHFVYVLRDFHLEIKIQGKTLTPNEYLESCLALRTVKTKLDDDYNLPRKCIRKYFKKRDCFVFDFPVMSGAKMRSLETLKDNELSEDFRKQSNFFCNQIFDKAQVKKLENGHVINGRMWSNLVRNYVKAIREGKVPNVENAVVAMAQMENGRIIKDCMDMYTSLMKKLKLPTEDGKVLSEYHFDSMKKVLSEFMAKAVFDKNNQFQRKLNEEIKNLYEHLIHENEVASQQKCQQVLGELEAPFRDLLANGAYAVSGGYKAYQADMTKVKNAYNARTDLGIKKNEVMLQFFQEKWQEGQSILATDTTITDTQRKAEEEKQRALEAEKQRVAAQEALEKAQKHADERERALQENMEQLREKMAQELEYQRKHHQEILEKRLAETRRLLEEGYEKEANAMKREIDNLNARIRDASSGDSGFCVIL